MMRITVSVCMTEQVSRSMPTLAQISNRWQELAGLSPELKRAYLKGLMAQLDWVLHAYPDQCATLLRAAEPVYQLISKYWTELRQEQEAAA